MSEMTFDELVPDHQVRRELGGITEMTVWRWDNEKSTAPEGWCPPAKIGRRKYRSRKMIEAVKQNLLRQAAEGERAA